MTAGDWKALGLIAVGVVLEHVFSAARAAWDRRRRAQADLADQVADLAARFDALDLDQAALAGGVAAAQGRPPRSHQRPPGGVE